VADKIVILHQGDNPPGIKTINMVFWFPAPGNPVPIANAISRYPLADPTEVIAKLRDGTLIEEAYNFRVPSTWTNAQITSYLLDLWTARAANVAAGTQAGQFYGAKCDQNDVWNLP
jgi:hypothetical protein